MSSDRATRSFYQCQAFSEAQIQRNFETNLYGPINVMRDALPILRAQGSGHIVNMSAIAGFTNVTGLLNLWRREVCSRRCLRGLARGVRTFWD
ncbi:MAG: SDR family NAD(P)-dependent oxidoreductase [Synechococcus sp.]